MVSNFKTVLPYIVLSGAIYLTMLLIGYITGLTTPVIAQAQAANFQAVQGNFIASQSLFLRALIIFATNTGIGFIMLMLGYMVAQTSGLWFGSFLVALIQGYKTGAIISSWASRGAMFTYATILPHGILELSASFASIGIGLMLGYHISMKRSEMPSYQGTTIIRQWKRVFYKYIVPMYFIAAFIEVYITPVVAYIILH